MGTATGIELTLLSAVAVQAEIEELMPRFRQQEGTEVKVNYDVNPAVAKRVVDGERSFRCRADQSLVRG